MPSKIEISYKTIVFTVLFLVALWFIIQIQDIISIVFVAFILMSALKPVAEKLEKLHIPRVLSVIGIYISLIFVIALIVNSLVPPLVIQTIHLGQNIPEYIRTFFPFITIDNATITSQITPFGENLLKVTVGVFSNIIALFTLFVISFYLLLQRQHLESQLATFMGGEAAGRIMTVERKVEEQLGAWVRGQMTLCVVIGLATFIGLALLGIPFILPLAILAGILEIVPIIGPIISAIPAILVAFTISPLLALATAALYFIIQQLEAHLVVPMVMRKAVGFPPLVTIIALMIGGRLAGIGGALLAVPVAVTIQTIIGEYFKLRETTKKIYPD